MEQLRISVSADDIKCGIEGDQKYCPIARAVRRLGKKKRIYVENNIDLGTSSYDMPASAHNFIDKFDNGLKVRPFSFIAKRVEW